MTDTPRSAPELEVTIQSSLATIRAHWHGMLNPPKSRPGAGGRGGPSITAGPKPREDDPLGVKVADDHKPSEADIDRTTRIVSLRREVADVLNTQCRWVAEERPVTSALPDGTSVVSMSLFLDRHAEWISWHDVDDNGFETDCLADLARRVQNLANPKRREYHHMGDCPFVVEDWFCAGKVRIHIGGDESQAVCSDCGTTGPVEWWESVLGVEMDAELVTLPKLVPIFAQRLHITVTDRTLRNWVRDGILTPTKVEDDGTRLFSPREAVRQASAMNQECPVCGKQFSGEDETCSVLCLSVLRKSLPRYADPKTHRPTAQRLDGWCPWPRNTVPDPHDTDRPDRCHWSDLPLDQCACGRHNREAS